MPTIVSRLKNRAHTTQTGQIAAPKIPRHLAVKVTAALDEQPVPPGGTCTTRARYPVHHQRHDGGGMAGQQTGTTVTAIRGGAVTVAEAADAFLSSPRPASPNTRRAYASVLDRLAGELGPGRQFAAVLGDEIAAALRPPVGRARPGDVEPEPGRRRVLAELVRPEEAVASPAAAPRRRAAQGEQRRHQALPRARVERLLSRRDVPLREKTLWRMLYETAARASEILGLNVEDLDLEQRRAAVRSKGGDTEFVYWDRAPAAPAAAPARRHLTRQRAAVPRRPQASPRATARAP